MKIHAAAQGRPCTCFVSEDTRLPFMTMPDGIEALLRLAEARINREQYETADQIIGQLLRNLFHASSREGCIATCKHAQDIQQYTAGSPDLRV